MPDRETYTVKIGSITQYVKVSGQVESSKDATLAFQTNGQVAFVGIKIGDSVTQGRVLATLSGADAQAVLLGAQANLTSTQAVLSQLRAGARKEELAIKEQALVNAKSALDQSYNALPDSIQNVDAVTSDVIKNKFGHLFFLNGSRYILSLNSCDQRLQGEVEAKRSILENVLADFQKKSSVISTISSAPTIDDTFESAYKSALLTNDLVNSVSNLLLIPCNSSNSNLDSYRVSLSLVKTSITALFSDITSKRTTLIVSKNIYNQSRADLTLIQAGADPYKIQAQVALVSQAQAQVAQAQSDLNKTIIRAPFDGTVSDVSLAFGETVTSGRSVINMIATDGFEVEAKIPEVDIAKIKVGEHVDVTLDAYGKDVIFPATVTRINPTAMTEGTVPVYKAIITFIGKDDRVREGMTANVQITTNNKTDVVAIPARFVKVLNQSEGIVAILLRGKIVTKNISLGIRGADGSFEVRGGLLEGDVILAPSTTLRSVQKQSK